MNATMLWTTPPAGYRDTLADRAALSRALSPTHPGWQLQGEVDGALVLVPEEDLNPRPWPVEETLSRDISPAKAEVFDARYRRSGRTLVFWAPADRRAISAYLPRATREVRDIVAKSLSVPPWQIDITAAWADGHLSCVKIAGAPLISDAVKRKAMWTTIMRDVLPNGSAGWTFEEDPITRTVTLRWGSPPRLPDLVRLETLLPDRVTPEEWSELPLGVGPDGRTLTLNLILGPHSLIAGPIGTGKSVAVTTLIVGALTRGHDLAIIDPVKGGTDFKALRPYARIWETDLAGAEQGLRAIYAEGQRRREVLDQCGVVKMADLTLDQRVAHDCRPLTVVMDELGSFFLEFAVPKNADKDDPLVQDDLDANANKMVCRSLTGKIAREFRYLGIHLILSTQRPDAAILGGGAGGSGGELRLNLSSTVQLAPPRAGVSADALRMMFHAEAVESASEQLTSLDDGVHQGLAVMAGEGGQARGFRVAFAPVAEIPAMLEARGVPHAVPFGSRGAHRRPAPMGLSGESWVTELTDMEFSLEELDAAVEPVANAGDELDWSDTDL